MVKYEDQISNSTTLEKKIFLGYHFWDAEGYNDDHFKVLRAGLDLGPNTDFTKDCVVMKFDSEGIHLGWKWSPCEEVSHFICQKSKHQLTYHKVASSKLVYYSILVSFGQRSIHTTYS